MCYAFKDAYAYNDHTWIVFQAYRHSVIDM